MSISVIAKGGSGISAPVFLPDGRLLVCSSGSGEVLQEDGSSLLPFANTAGSPSSCCIDSSGSVFVMDAAHAAVLLHKGGHGTGGGFVSIVSEWEGKALLGPHSGVFASEGELFFTDSGPAGESNLERPKGSVYVVTGEGSSRILRPILSECLAYPTGIALGGGDGEGPGGAPRFLYVCEGAANRLLRGFERPSRNVWHFSVFHQFAGRLGPSAVVADPGRGLIYVARPEMPGASGPSTPGVIAVLGPGGELLKEVSLPGFPEVSGLALTPDNSALIVTEASTNSILRVQL